MTLAELGLAAADAPAARLRVRGLALDSRAARPGVLFAALPGTAEHGARFAPDAVARGAVAVLTDAAGAALLSGHLPAAVPVLIDPAPRAALARAAARWFGVQPRVVAAVTGTNGKTSVASFTRQIWERMGRAAVAIGTTGVEGAIEAPLAHTTPDPLTLHELLARAAGAGVSHAVMEASSHGLAQSRLDGVALAAGAFTNLSQDHLDYHADLDDYFAAKARLFAELLPEGAGAVINADDARAGALLAIARERRLGALTFGRAEGADLRILATRPDETGQLLRFAWRGGPARQVRLELIGEFQAANALAAAGLVIASAAAADEGAAPTEAALETLEALRGVRGRMELVARRDNGAPVFVDYAHTPDALAKALAALRPHVLGRIVVVFGAGGDRDRAKRPLMGRAAAEGADVVIVTDDNPRSEDPAAIRAEVLAGCPEALEIGDRAEAILRGAALLGPGDALLIAGKGHETGQIIGDQVYPFSDAEQASIAVAAIEGRAA